MNLPNNQKYDADTLDRLAELWALGRTADDIGRCLRVPKNSICRLARNARLSGDPRFPARNAGRPHSAPKPKPSRAPRPARKAALPRRRPVKSLPKPAPKPVSVIRPRIWELRERQCRYPVAETDTREHLFCAEATNGESYCPTHLALCNQPLHARRAA
jgi:hypothetical protein